MEAFILSLLVLILGNMIYLERKTSQLDEKISRIEKLVNNIKDHEGR